MDRPLARLTGVDDTAIDRWEERTTARKDDGGAPWAARAQAPATVHHATYVALVVLSAVGLVSLLVLVRALVG